jgi:hypothetical protein
MDIHTRGERVCVEGLSGTFIVAWVDDETQSVDLVPAVGRGPMKEDVPWQKLSRCWLSPIKKVHAAPRLRN